MELNEKIKQERTRRGLSQAALGRAVGISQPAVKKIESGATVKSRFVWEIAEYLGIPMMKVELIDEAPADATPSNGASQPTAARPKPLPKRDDPNQPVPVFASAEGGDGSMVLTSEPVEWVARPNLLPQEEDLYGVVIEGNSMMKAFRPGDTAWVHPRYRERRDEPCVFRRYDEATGEVSMTIKWLNDFNHSVWKVEQFNPPREFEMKRNDWPECYRVLGKKNRS